MKVYKYRGGDDKTLSRDLDSLIQNSFYAPTVEKLNDPAEAYVDYTEIESIFKKMNATHVSKALDIVVSLRHTMGVYSLSKNPCDELLWAYYANSHQGFCIEYDLERLTLEARVGWTAFDVIYNASPQKLDIDDVLAESEGLIVTNKIIGTKSHRWAHEDELRIVTSQSGINYYAEEAVSGIYFGCRCENKVIDRVRRKLSGKNFTYYQCKFSKNEYKIKIQKLEYNKEIDGELIEYKAPIDNLAIASKVYTKPENIQYHNFLEKAVELVRRDKSCVNIVYADFSVNKFDDKNRPYIYIQYNTSVKTPYNDEITRYFTIQQLQNIE